MTSNEVPELPMLSVIVSDFIRDIEERLKADEDKYMCCVCFEPFANVPLKCPHKLCSTCYEKLDTCPLCRVKFREDICVFANFDACIWTRSTKPVTYDVFVHGGIMRNSPLLTTLLIGILTSNQDKFSFGVHHVNDSTVFRYVSNVNLCVDTIRRHTSLTNSPSVNLVRRALVDEGILDDVEENCTL